MSSTQPDPKRVLSDVNRIEDLLSIGIGDSELRDPLEDESWVRSTGKTPLEFLTAVYRHPLVQMRDRISAAKTVVEYTHMKKPSSIEMTGRNGDAIKVSGAMLAGLSDAELETMQRLLEKAAIAAEGS